MRAPSLILVVATLIFLAVSAFLIAGVVRSLLEGRML